MCVCTRSERPLCSRVKNKVINNYFFAHLTLKVRHLVCYLCVYGERESKSLAGLVIFHQLYTHVRSRIMKKNRTQATAAAAAARKISTQKVIKK